MVLTNRRVRLIAIMLGRLEMDVDECIAAYLNFIGPVFQRNPWRWPIDWLDWKLQLRPRFSSDKLEKAIKDIVYSYTNDEDMELMAEEDPHCKM